MLLFGICLRLRTRSFLRMTLLQKFEPLWQQSTEQERQMQKKGVDDYNAYREFHDSEVEGHIIAAFMVFCGMENMEGMFLHVPPGYIPIFVQGFLV